MIDKQNAEKRQETNTVQVNLLNDNDEEELKAKFRRSATGRDLSAPNVFKLTGDTYAMAYKSMNSLYCEKLRLKRKDWNVAFKNACVVFAIQAILILCVFSMILSPEFKVRFPDSVYTLAARFVCSILMHLQVESDIRQAIQMMKYSVNHWNDFRNP